MGSSSRKSIQKAIQGWGWQVLAVAREQWPIVLLGNVGPRWWQVFKSSPEYADGARDPMDRCARRLGETLARALGCSAVYPSDGPPYPPFLAWARQSGQAHASKLGPLIHPKYGLWHAYRAALVFDGPGRFEHSEETDGTLGASQTANPCESCPSQPCLTACPAHAIGLGRYDIPSCLSHLIESPADCRTLGCAARRACPVGAEFYYGPEQAGFHMQAFFAAQSKKHR